MISAENVEKWRFLCHTFFLWIPKNKASYEHDYENAEIRQNCRFLGGLYLFFLFFFTQSSLLPKMLKNDGLFMKHVFSLNPWRISAAYEQAYKCWNKTKCRFLRGLYLVFLFLFFSFFSPFMISAENVEKWRFFMLHLFSLKPRRISASYEHAYENAEIRQKCRFLRGLYILPNHDYCRKCWNVTIFMTHFLSLNPWRKVSASYVHAYENAEIRQKCRFLRGLYFSPIMRSAENVEKCRCFMPQLFSLKPQRISLSYEHAYENAKIRQSASFEEAYFL